MYISTQIKSYFGFCPFAITADPMQFCGQVRSLRRPLKIGTPSPESGLQEAASPAAVPLGRRVPPGGGDTAPGGPGPPCGDRAARPGAGRVAALPAPRPPRGRVRRLRPFTIHGANTYTWGGGGERRPSGPRPDFRGDRLDLSELVVRVETGSREEP